MSIILENQKESLKFWNYSHAFSAERESMESLMTPKTCWFISSLIITILKLVFQFEIFKVHFMGRKRGSKRRKVWSECEKRKNSNHMAHYSNLGIHRRILESQIIRKEERTVGLIVRKWKQGRKRRERNSRSLLLSIFQFQRLQVGTDWQNARLPRFFGGIPSNIRTTLEHS